MNAIDLLALISFGILVLSWAVLPSGVRHSKEVKYEGTPVALTPVSDNP